MLLKIVFDVDVRSARWTDGDLRTIKKAVRAALSHQIGKLNQRAAISIVLTTDKQIQKLNRQWRKKNKPTNILSFPTDALANAGEYPAQIPLPLGDLVLAHETCSREVKTFGIKFQHHIMHLAIHGTLHLLGYGHATDADHRQMIRTELAILTQLGLANPYPFMQDTFKDE